FFFQAEDGIRDFHVTGVQTCALPISAGTSAPRSNSSVPAPRSPPSVTLALLTSACMPRLSRLPDRKTAPAGNSPLTGRPASASRSEERRVGKEGRCGWAEE